MFQWKVLLMEVLCGYYFCVGYKGEVLICLQAVLYRVCICLHSQLEKKPQDIILGECRALWGEREQVL